MWVYSFMRSKLDQIQTFVIDLVFNLWDKANVFNKQVNKPILPQHTQAQQQNQPQQEQQRQHNSDTAIAFSEINIV